MAGIYDALWSSGPEDDDTSEFGKEGFDPIKELLVVLVDCGNSMLRPLEETDNDLSFHQIVMGALAKYARRRIIASSADEMAVVMYGTARQNSEVAKKESLTEFDHIYVQHPLGPITAKRIKDLEGFADQDSSFFEQAIGSRQRGGSVGEADDLVHSLWTASQLLGKSSSASKSAKKLWIFTDNDFSQLSDHVKRNTVLGRTRDLMDTKVAIELFPLACSSGPIFCMDHLWKDALKLGGEDEAKSIVEGASSRVEELTQAIYRKASAKRTLASLKWIIADGFHIAVQVYKLVGFHSKGSATSLEAATNQPLRRETAYTCSDTGAVIHRIDKKYVTIRNEKVVLEDAVMQSWKSQFPACVTLLGFKSMDKLKDYHQIRTPLFLYPDEKKMPGSSSAFIALYAKMLKMRKIAVVSFCRGSMALPRLAALVAQPEEQVELENGSLEQSKPPGMHVIFLPFSDDIRSPEAATTACPASQECIDKAEAMIKDLSLGDSFTSTQLPNPALQQHYAVLHALALGEQAEPSQLGLRDDTDAAKWDNRIGSIWRGQHVESVQALKNAVYGPGGLPSGASKQAAAGGKRKATESRDMDNTDFAALARQDNLGSLTVPQLKGFLAHRGLSTVGKKVDLLARVKEALWTKGEKEL